MMSLMSIILFINFIFSRFGNTEGALSFNVIKFGAKPDGNTDATQAFLRAWASACAARATSTIYIPKGRYLIRSAEFRGPCKGAIKVQIDGILIAPANHRVLGNPDYWILFIQVNRLSVIGGALDAQGAGLWDCKTSGKNCPNGARSITFNWVNNAQIRGLTSINSQLMHLVINSCNNVKVSSVKIIAPDLSPNTDGIHVQSSTGVIITNTVIKTGDDCISIGPGTRNLWMEKIKCGPGHGVSIGSLGRDFNEAGVENVTLVNSIFSGSDNGLRIKTWARPSKGFVRNINYRNIVMKNVQNPIIIDQNYCPNNQGCPRQKFYVKSQFSIGFVVPANNPVVYERDPLVVELLTLRQSSGIKINQVTYENIQGTSATQVAMAFDCSPTNPCSGIKLKDIKLTYLDKVKHSLSAKTSVGLPAVSSCRKIVCDTPKRNMKNKA